MFFKHFVAHWLFCLVCVLCCSVWMICLFLEVLNRLLRWYFLEKNLYFFLFACLTFFIFLFFQIKCFCLILLRESICGNWDGIQYLSSFAFHFYLLLSSFYYYLIFCNFYILIECIIIFLNLLRRVYFVCFPLISLLFLYIFLPIILYFFFTLA